MTLSKGIKVPVFECSSSTHPGKIINLSWISGSILLYFFPRKITDATQKDLIELKENFELFKENQISIIAISPLPKAALQNLALDYDLPYDLIEDEGSRLAQLYGVNYPLIPTFIKKLAYLIDERKRVAETFKDITEGLRIIQTNYFKEAILSQRN